MLKNMRDCPYVDRIGILINNSDFMTMMSLSNLLSPSAYRGKYGNGEDGWRET